MKRRITSMLLAAAMTITMLTGCGSQGKETEKTDTGAIVLDMYHSWSTDSERGAALDKLIQEFNKEYEGKIEVKVTGASGRLRVFWRVHPLRRSHPHDEQNHASCRPPLSDPSPLYCSSLSFRRPGLC